MKSAKRYQPARAALRWYDRHRRAFPWRESRDGEVSPYRVWLGEIMLQQTTTAAARPYFRDFTERWKTIHELAAAPLNEVLRQWAGLGYYRRAHLLHQCAQEVVKEYGGEFPRSEKALLRLPGIGAYSAAAIAAIAFNERAAAIDANIERVLARLYLVRARPPEAKKIIADIAKELVPKNRSGDYTQALMDIGATICRPKNPLCLACPFHKRCLSREAGEQNAIPQKTPKKPKRRLRATAFLLIRDDGAIFLRERDSRGLLAGLMEVPTSEWSERDSDKPLQAAPIEAQWFPHEKELRHIFTHIDLTLKIRSARLSRAQSQEMILMSRRRALWVKPHQLKDHALPTLTRKIIERAQNHESCGTEKKAVKSEPKERRRS